MATGSEHRTSPVKDWVGVSAPFIPRDDTAIGEGAAPARPSKRWPPDRLAAIETLWGPGFNSPGGAPEIMHLAMPLGLDASHKLLLLGGGLGGPACVIAEGSGAWVTSFEADADLAALARNRTAKHACRSRIEVQNWNPQYPDFGIRSSDHALLLEAMRGADPARTLDSMASALRPQSKIVMTEMVAETQAPDSDREFAAWCRLENRLPALPRGEAITATLKRLRYDVRVVEDISSAHVSAALAGWRNAVKSMAHEAAPEVASALGVVTEAELWLLRIRVMRRFGFRLLRWQAVGTGSKAAA